MHIPIVKCYANNTIFYTYQSLRNDKHSNIPKSMNIMPRLLYDSYDLHPIFTYLFREIVAFYGLPTFVSSRFDRWMRVLFRDCCCDCCCDCDWTVVLIHPGQ